MSVRAEKSCKQLRGKRKGNRGGTEENRSVTVALARSKTLLCKLTLRVCIAGSERENGGRAGGRDGVRKRQRAERNVKRGEQCERDRGGTESVKEK